MERQGGSGGAAGPPRVRQGIPPHSYPHSGVYGQSEGLTERINEPPWGRCLQGAVDARWVVVVVVAPQGSGITSSRALGITVTLLRSNGDASMGLDDGAMR